MAEENTKSSEVKRDGPEPAGEPDHIVVLDGIVPGKKILVGDEDYIVTHLDGDGLTFYMTRDMSFTPSVETPRE